MIKIKIQNTNELKNILKENSVFVASNNKFFVADEVNMPEKFCSYLRGGVFFPMGYFSYSHSELPLDVKVGRYCYISWNLNVLMAAHPLQHVTTSSFGYDSNSVFIREFANALGHEPLRRKIPNKPFPVIENDVWIGSDAILARGITLSTGCVVAAGSVVTKNVEPYSIVGGNPAKHIRFRFPEKTRLRLLESKWWNYSIYDIKECDLSDPDRFLDNIEKKQYNEFQPGWLKKKI